MVAHKTGRQRVQRSINLYRATSNILPPVIFFLFIILLWEIVVYAFKVPEFLLPTPHQIGLKIIANAGLLARHTAVTMFESISGFAIGSIVGIIAAIFFTHSRIIELSIYPYAIALKTTPLVALAPLLVLWFGNGMLAKIVMSALICFFPVIVNSTKGLKAISPESLDLMDSLSATKWQVLTKLRFPASLPYIFSALKISATLSVIGALVGELAGSTQGIGYIIIINSYRTETVMVFAAITIASLGGIAFFLVVSLLERLFVYWEDPSEGAI